MQVKYKRTRGGDRNFLPFLSFSSLSLLIIIHTHNILTFLITFFSVLYYLNTNLLYRLSQCRTFEDVFYCTLVSTLNYFHIFLSFTAFTELHSSILVLQALMLYTAVIFSLSCMFSFFLLYSADTLSFSVFSFHMLVVLFFVLSLVSNRYDRLGMENNIEK